MAEPAATSTKTVDESGNATVVTVASGTEATAAAPEASVPKKNAAWIAEGYCPVSYFNPEGAAHKGSDDASAQAAPPTSAAYRPPGMQTEHLRAPANAVLGRLLALHAPLLEAGYRLDCGRALEAA